MQYLRGQFSRPINRAHFHQLCHSLVDEHWHASFTLEQKAIDRSEKVRFWSHLENTDCVVGINCQWHGKSDISPTPLDIQAAVAVADCFRNRIDRFFILTSSNASIELSEYVIHLNSQHAASGKFTIEIWDWGTIEETLATTPLTVKKYLELGMAMRPYGFQGAIEQGIHKEVWLKRLPNGTKKDRDAPASGTKPQAVFSHDVADAFEQFVHTNQHRDNSRYLRVLSAPWMGHAIALIHQSRQIEIWLLSPEPRDTEFRVDTEAWVRHLTEREVKQAFAHVLLKNYHNQDHIRLNIYIVRHVPPVAGKPPLFTVYPTRIERSWHQLYPNEVLKKTRYVLAEAVIEGAHVKVTHSAFLFGCTLIHNYHFPLSSVSTKILKDALVNRSYPNAVPHSHEILLNGEIIYWRALEQFDAHTRKRVPQQPSQVKRITCRFCSGFYWGHRDESSCADCDLKHSTHSHQGKKLTHTDLYFNQITRQAWDF